MQKIIELIFKKFLIKKIFRKYRNSLPTKTEFDNPKMEYHILADSVVWEDEGIEKCHPKLENAFRYVLNYRTNIISNEFFENENKEKQNKKIFELAKKYFPDWIGFNEIRCSYNIELSEKIKRIRKISEWKMDKIMNEILVEKNEDNELPIPNIWRPKFKKIVNAFVNKDYKLSSEIENVNPISVETAEQIKEYIEDYGEELIELPNETWNSSVYIIY